MLRSNDRGLKRVYARSWWLALQLVRRYPDFVIYQAHPGGSSYDVLIVGPPTVVSPKGAGEASIWLNRAGRIVVRREHGEVAAATWDEVASAPVPDLILDRLVEAAGWRHSPRANHDATSPRGVAYGFLATALGLLVDEPETWDVCSFWFDSSHDDEVDWGLSEFVHSAGVLRATPRLGIHGEPESHYWGLARDGRMQLAVSIEGRLHAPDGDVIELVPALEWHGFNMRALVAATLAPWIRPGSH